MATVAEIQSRSCRDELLAIKRRMKRRLLSGGELIAVAKLYNQRRTHIREITEVFGASVLPAIYKAADAMWIKDFSKKVRKRHPLARGRSGKLTPEQALAVKRSTGASAVVADFYGISIQSVQDIRAGRRWRHLA